MIPWSAWVLLFALLIAPILAAACSGLKLWMAWNRRRGRLEGEPRWIERRAVWVPCAGFAALYGLCLAYGLLVEPFWVEVTHTEIPVAAPVLGYDRFRIVHLTDLHLEGFGRREKSVLEAVAREKPHLIVITGDFMNGREHQSDLVRFLQGLKAEHGIYGVPGNWDGKFPIGDLFEGVGARLLQDDHHRLVRFGADLLIVGQDYHRGRSLGELLKGAGDDSFRLFLHHSPDAVDQLAEGRVDLFLCGHTHGGQVRLPLYGAVLTMSAQHKKYERGLFRVAPPASAREGGTPMYVSRGIGMTGIGPRVRFLARPEVAVIDLVASTK